MLQGGNGFKINDRGGCGVGASARVGVKEVDEVFSTKAFNICFFCDKIILLINKF